MSSRRRLGFLDEAARHPDQPFFAHVNFMKVHQPNLPAPEFQGKSLSKSKYADSVVELDTRIGRIMDKLRELEARPEHPRLLHDRTTAPGRTSIRTPATPRSGEPRDGPRRGNRVPAIAVWPGKTKPGVRNHDLDGGPRPDGDFRLGRGAKLPDQDREGQPIVFDSYDLSPILLGKGRPSGSRGSTSRRMS